MTVQQMNDSLAAKSGSTKIRINVNSEKVKKHRSKRIRKWNRIIFVTNVLIFAFRIAIVAGSLALIWTALTEPEVIRSVLGK